MSTKIGTDAWIQNAIKAARDNRANQMNPSCPVYWASRMEPRAQPSPLLAIFAAATIGAAATAGTILAIQKIVKIKKEKEEEVEGVEEGGELTKIEIEGEEEVKEAD